MWRPRRCSSWSVHQAAQSAQVRVAPGCPSWSRNSWTKARSESAAAPHRSLPLIEPSRRSQSSSRATPASRLTRSQLAVGRYSPSASRSGRSAIMSNRLRRRRPRRSTSSRSSTSRGASRSVNVVPGRPFHGMSAAVRWCSTRRAYGRCAGHSTAMRSNGVPARAASTTRRVASRTSSSASVVDTIATGRGDVPSGELAPSVPTTASSEPTSCRVSVSAVGSPVSWAMMRTSARSPSARTNVIASPCSSWGRYSTRLRKPVGAWASTDRVAPAKRSASSYHWSASAALMFELM